MLQIITKKHTFTCQEGQGAIAEKAKKEGKPFEKIWCVFDADPTGQPEVRLHMQPKAQAVQHFYKA